MRGTAQIWLCAAACSWQLVRLTSGTAKEATIALDLPECTGAGAYSCTDAGADPSNALANLLFVLLSAPAWLLFLDALRHSSRSTMRRTRIKCSRPSDCVLRFLFSPRTSRQENLIIQS